MSALVLTPLRVANKRSTGGGLAEASLLCSVVKEFEHLDNT